MNFGIKRLSWKFNASQLWFMQFIDEEENKFIWGWEMSFRVYGTKKICHQFEHLMLIYCFSFFLSFFWPSSMFFFFRPNNLLSNQRLLHKYIYSYDAKKKTNSIAAAMNNCNGQVNNFNSFLFCFSFFFFSSVRSNQISYI